MVRGVWGHPRRSIPNASYVSCRTSASSAYCTCRSRQYCARHGSLYAHCTSLHAHSPPSYASCTALVPQQIPMTQSALRAGVMKAVKRLNPLVPSTFSVLHGDEAIRTAGEWKGRGEALIWPERPERLRVKAGVGAVRPCVALRRCPYAL